MFYQRQPSFLMLTKTDLTKPEFSNSKESYQLKFINSQVTFVSDSDTNRRGSFVSQLNGEFFTSAVLIPKETNNALFRSGSLVLFARQWFVEVSDTINDLRPFDAKDITELICDPEGVGSNDMKWPFTTTHITPEQPKSETKDPKLRPETKDPNSKVVTKDPNSKAETEDPDATKSNSQTIIIVILTSIIIFLILIIISWSIYSSCQARNKDIVENKSNRKGKILSEEASDVKTSESGAFDAQSDTDYSKPIQASSNASPTTDASTTELGKPTDLFVNNNTMRSD